MENNYNCIHKYRYVAHFFKHAHDTPFSGANWTAGTRGIVNRDVFPGLIRRFQRNDGILFIHFSFKQNFMYIYTFFLFMSQCGVVFMLVERFARNDI